MSLHAHVRFLSQDCLKTPKTNSRTFFLYVLLAWSRSPTRTYVNTYNNTTRHLSYRTTVRSSRYVFVRTRSTYVHTYQVHTTVTNTTTVCNTIVYNTMYLVLLVLLLGTTTVYQYYYLVVLSIKQ